MVRTRIHASSWSPSGTGAKDHDPFLGRSMGGGGSAASFSSQTAKEVDAQVRTFIDTNYKRAKNILKKHEDKLHLLSEALLEHETLDKKQIDDLFEGKPVIAKKGTRKKQKAEAEKTKRADERAQKTEEQLESKRKKPATSKKTTAKKSKSQDKDAE